MHSLRYYDHDGPMSRKEPRDHVKESLHPKGVVVWGLSLYSQDLFGYFRYIRLQLSMHKSTTLILFITLMKVLQNTCNTYYSVFVYWHHSNSCLFLFTVPHVRIQGSPDIHVDQGSVINLTCIISSTPEPPVYVFWYQGEKVCYAIPYNNRIHVERL